MAGMTVMSVAYTRVAYAGNHKLAGTVDRVGEPGSYRVMLFRIPEWKLIDVKWSDSGGAYAFMYLDDSPKSFLVMAFDHSAEPVNAAISDQVTLEPMP